jgi:hypothetical protein
MVRTALYEGAHILLISVPADDIDRKSARTASAGTDNPERNTNQHATTATQLAGNRRMLLDRLTHAMRPPNQLYRPRCTLGALMKVPK